MSENFEKFGQAKPEEKPTELEAAEGKQEAEGNKFLSEAKIKIMESIGEPQKYESEEEGNYFYFSPLEYFRKGFIDQEMINRLSSGASILNVGAGNGDLEKVLQKGYGISESQISISDIKLHPKLKGVPFEKYEFDMTEQWPNFPHGFDYILFPESFGVAFAERQSDNRTHRFYEDTERIVKEVSSGHEISKEDSDFFINLIIQDLPNTYQKYITLRRALNNLNDGGEIRMSGDLLSDQEETFLKLILTQFYRGIEIRRNANGILMLVKPKPEQNNVGDESKREKGMSNLDIDLLMTEPYRAISHSDGESMIYSAIRKVKYWHDEFKPDYIFLTETSAVPAGYLFKEAWKTAYPDEDCPKFFRVDPKAMGNKSNVEELPGYQEKLIDYLKKRVKKEDARIVIFDEQPVSRDSQTAVKNKIIETLNIPVDNIEISTGVTVPFDRQDWASSGYPGLRITQKETPPGHKYHKYKSADEIRFVGKVLSGSSKKDIRGEYAGWVKTKDLIYDLKLAGKKAGTMIVLNMDFNKWQMDFNWNKERRRAYEEAKRKREEAGKKVIPSRKIRREKK